MRRSRCLTFLLLALVGTLPPLARATCDAIPGVQQSFRGALGVLDRPFARPGDPLTLRIDPACHPGTPAPGPTANDHVVTIVFAPGGGVRNAVVVRESCLGFVAERRRCEEALAGGTATCVVAADADLALVERAGLRFRFPDTDALVTTPGDTTTAADSIGLAGPAAIAVTRAREPLPCGLGAARCADQLGLVACVDDLYLEDGGCGTALHPVFGHFTALPAANDFGALCSTPDTPCTGDATDVRIALDRAGNLLVPMDWRRVLVRRADVPVARLLRGSILLEAFAGAGLPLRLPDDSVLGSFSVQGVPLPPIFTPQADPLASDAVALFGTADAPEGVLRIARRPACAGGDLEGFPCQTDAQCAPGTCAGGLFDFSTRVVAGGGPLVLRRGACLGGPRALRPCAATPDCLGGRCLTFTADAADPVPLDGLNTAENGYAFVVNEALLGEDRNGDGDGTDDVVQLVDETTGGVLPIGENGPGRAVVRLRQPPFSRPALVAAGDVVAFLEPEALEHDRDANGDGDRFDTVLRVFRLTGTAAVDLVPGPALVADAAPLVDGQGVAIADERLFFRTPEAALARRTTTVASRQYDGRPVGDASFLRTPQSISADGRWLTFVNYDPFVVPGDVRCTPISDCRDAFLLDRDADGDGLYDEPDGVSVTRLGASTPPRPTTAAAISADGRVVAFVSHAPLVPGDTNQAADVYVHTRDTAALERVSVGAGGTQVPNGVVDAPRALALSADGSVVAFASVSALDAADTNRAADVFVRDRRAGTTERVSAGPGGAVGNDLSFVPLLSGLGVSADGRRVAFDGDAANLVAGDGNDAGDVFVHDRDTHLTVRVSVGVRGEEANGASRLAAIAPDGSAVAFTSVATNLVPGATSGLGDVFVHDLASATTAVASVASTGALADRGSSEAAFSADGRFVAVTSRATTLVPEDRNGIQDVFVHDRLTGLTERVSLRFDGAEQPNPSGSGEAGQPSVTAGGRGVVFVATENLAAGVSGHRLVYAREPDPTDSASDLTGDGRLDATVLRVLDLAAPPGTAPATLCPAEAVAVAGGLAAFLRPEAAGAAPGCPPGPDLNGDGDADDLVVHLVDGGGAVTNLGLAATAVALSPRWVAALVPEAADDGGADRLVAHLRPTAGGGGWTRLGQVADTVAVRGDQVLLVTPEAGQGADLNGDGDRDDRVLQIVDGASGAVRSLGLAVEEFVASETLVALRVREAAQGRVSLDADDDIADDVLFVYDLATGELHAPGQAVTPCRLEACDPRLPYRPLGDTVRFLTLEAAQGADLNGDDDQDDLVLQTFNVRAAPAARAGFAPAARGARGARVVTLAAVAAGVCSDSGRACATDDACGTAARCIVPPGRCVTDTDVPCRPGVESGCGPAQFCGSDPGVPAATCRRVLGECHAGADCPRGARCVGEGQRLQRLVGPLAPDRVAGAALPAAGRCVDPAGEEGPACRTGADCGPGATCRADVLTAAAADRDGDELPDAVDLCPDVPDPAQADADGDGVGDACDRRTVANGVREPGEECDGAADGACPGRCRPDGTCGCANEVRGTRARFTRRGARRGMTLRLRVPLEAYAGEAFVVRVDDAEGRPLVSTGVGALPTVTPGRLWRARGGETGLRAIRVVRLARPGYYRITIRARRWAPFGGERPARVTVSVGEQCFAIRALATGRGSATTSTSTTSSTAPDASTTTSSSTTSTTVPSGPCCPAERIVLETIAGNVPADSQLRLGALPPLPLPPGTRLVLDTGPPDRSCRHALAIPPGGFEMPPFCQGVAAWTGDVVARGCAQGTALGRGTLWDGGASAPDPDLRVIGDTRDGLCNPPAESCEQRERQAAENVLGGRTVTSGDGVADARGLHLALELPALLRSWDVREPAGQAEVCPDPDGLPHLATDDSTAAVFTTLRLTTGRATAAFVDTDEDGCSQVGASPAGPRTVEGVPAPGPCCQIGQELVLAGANAEFSAEFLGDVITTVRMRARVVACEPPPAVPATCDAVEGGGRVVTAMGADHDECWALVPVAGGRLVAVGTADNPPGRPARSHFALAGYDPDGRLDAGFGPDGTGRVYTDFGFAAYARAAVRDGAGRIVAAGETDDATSAVALARYVADGRLDPTFGEGGVVLTDVAGGNHRAGAVAITADERILVAAHQDALALLRYRSDGTLDPDFGAGGIVLVHTPSREAEGARAMALQPDGRIVTGGYRKTSGETSEWLLARFHPDGRLDESFGTAGIVATAVGPLRGEIAALAVLDDGAIVAAGFASSVAGVHRRALVVGRYRPDGTLDPAFGTGGLVTTTVAGTQEDGLALLALPGGTILVGGSNRPDVAHAMGGEPIDGAGRWLLARYDAATGRLDTTFGTGGVVLTSFGGFDDRVRALLALPDGKILGGGLFDRNGGFGYEGDFALARYLADGRPDPTFGGPCGWEVEALTRPRP